MYSELYLQNHNNITIYWLSTFRINLQSMGDMIIITGENVNVINLDNVKVIIRLTETRGRKGKEVEGRV